MFIVNAEQIAIFDPHTVGKNVSKVLERVLGSGGDGVGLTQSQNWAFLRLKARLRRPIPTLVATTFLLDAPQKSTADLILPFDTGCEI